VATDALRTCKACNLTANTDDELELFVKEEGCKYNRRLLCYSCNRKRVAKWGEKNPEKNIIGKLTSRARRTYKITYEEYIKRMATSDCCEICGSKEKLSYDHDHKTMKFRGVLCNKCNRSIGLLGDTIEGIEKVLFYLNKEEQRV